MSILLYHTQYETCYVKKYVIKYKKAIPIVVSNIRRIDIVTDWIGCQFVLELNVVFCHHVQAHSEFFLDNPQSHLS
jgi:hypothetical protein